MEFPPRDAMVTAACWSPWQPSVAVLGLSSGIVEVWDVLQSASKPQQKLRVSKYAISGAWPPRRLFTRLFWSFISRIRSVGSTAGVDQTFWTADHFQTPHHIIRFFHYLVNMCYDVLKKALRLTCEQGRCAP